MQTKSVIHSRRKMTSCYASHGWKRYLSEVMISHRGGLCLSVFQSMTFITDYKVKVGFFDLVNGANEHLIGDDHHGMMQHVNEILQQTVFLGWCKDKTNLNIIQRERETDKALYNDWQMTIHRHKPPFLFLALLRTLSIAHFPAISWTHVTNSIRNHVCLDTEDWTYFLPSTCALKPTRDLWASTNWPWLDCRVWWWWRAWEWPCLNTGPASAASCDHDQILF